jgi:hypothetical protein
MIKIFLLTSSAFALLFLGMGLKMWVSGKESKKACSCSFGDKDLKPSSSCCGGKSDKKLIQLKKL